MTKNEAIRRAGSAANLARLLGLTRSAISQWSEIPQLQLYRLREIKPRWFRKRNGARA